MKRFGQVFDFWWLPAFFLLSVSWLFAPAVHHAHYGILAVISHYEALSEPYNYFFRLCDVLGAAVGLAALWRSALRQTDRWLSWLLTALFGLAIVDALFPLGCNGACMALDNLSRVVHEAESGLSSV